MKSKSALIALGVFAGLLVLVLATREKNVSVGIKKLELPALDKEKVTAFEMSGAKAALIKKDGENWTVADPAKPDTKFPVDDYSIKSTVDSLAELQKPSEFVTDKADKHAEFEVDDAKGIRVKIYAGATVLADFVFGKYGKGGGSYVRKSGDNQVFSSKARLGSLMKKDLGQWRRRQMVSTKAEEISAVTVKTADGAVLNIESADGKEWKLKDGTVTPPGFRFDAQAAARLAQNVVNLRAQEFLDTVTPEQEPALGLTGLHDEVQAQTKDGKKMTFLLGQELDSKLGNTVSTLKAQFDSVDAAGTKDSRITTADLTAALADKTRTEDVKKALESAQVHFDLLDTGVWGFKVKDQGIAQEDLESAQKMANLVPVRIEGDKQTYLVPSYSVQQVKKKLADYRDLGLLALDVDKITKVTVNVGKKTVVQKDGTEWKVLEPKELPAGFEFDGQQVVSQLNMLKGMKGAKLVDPAPPDAVTGLNKPTGTVELVMVDKKVITLKFGKDVTNADKNVKEVYVRGNVDAAVYTLGEYQKKRYDNGVEIFRKPKPPPNMGGMGGGGMQGLENLPPDVRRKLEAQLKMAH